MKFITELRILVPGQISSAQNSSYTIRNPHALVLTFPNQDEQAVDSTLKEYLQKSQPGAITYPKSHTSSMF